MFRTGKPAAAVDLTVGAVADRAALEDGVVRHGSSRDGLGFERLGPGAVVLAVDDLRQVVGLEIDRTDALDLDHARDLRKRRVDGEPRRVAHADSKARCGGRLGPAAEPDRAEDQSY